MRFLNLASAALVAAALFAASGSAMAATAQNTQAGAYGTSSNAGHSTPGSPRVKHAAKHKAMKKGM